MLNAKEWEMWMMADGIGELRAFGIARHKTGLHKTRHSEGESFRTDRKTSFWFFNLT